MALPNHKKEYRLVIFDMDGTLTEELLDFGAIRREIGLPAEGGILEHLVAMRGAARVRAEEILERHEMTAARVSALHAGATEVLGALTALGIKKALLTRNSAACAEAIVERHRLELDLVASRENLPHKPHPQSILNVTGHFGVRPTQTLMVGDSLYDLQAAAAAGTDSALLCVEGPWPEFAAIATHGIRRLLEVLDLVQRAEEFL